MGCLCSKKNRESIPLLNAQSENSEFYEIKLVRSGQQEIGLDLKTLLRCVMAVSMFLLFAFSN